MKIKSLELINNRKIKNIKLDFTIDDEVQDTIILAGNNGCGKTTILDNLHLITNKMQTDIMKQSNFAIKSIVILDKNEKDMIRNNLESSKHQNTRVKECISMLDKTNEFEYCVNFTEGPYTYERYSFYAILNNNKKEIDVYTILELGKLAETMSSFYSVANINYTLSEIGSITTIDLDEKERNIKTDSRIGTDVKQTFVDIQNLDAQDFLKWASETKEKTIDESKMNIRIKRFSNAFNYIFPTLTFDEIVNSNGQKDVIFKNAKGDKISIDDLSTGEKQIIIRGGYLLKYQKAIQNNIILIDEPELSLHPEWQKKILQFYKRLFIDENGKQTAQIFVATHSPFIVHNSSRYNDKVIILNKDENDNVKVVEQPTYYSYDNNTKVETAFNIKEFATNKNILFTEGTTDKEYLDKAIELYSKGKVNFEVHWIGKYNKNGNVENTGCTALNNLLKILEANPKAFNNKVGLLYDSDTNKENEQHESYFVYTLTGRSSAKYKIGIENQLTLPDDFEYEKYYSQRTDIDDYGAERIIQTLDKEKLCKDICSRTDVKNILINLEEVIKEIEKQFKHS